MAGVAVVLLFVLIFLLTGNKNIFGSDATIYVYMGDSAAMTEGGAVRLNGILIGQIHKIALSGVREPGRTVRFDLEVRQDMLKSIPVDSTATIGAENVLGTKFINIKQGASPQHIQDGGTLIAREDRDFLEIVQSAQPLLESMQITLKRIDAIVDQVQLGKGSIGKLLVDETLYNRMNDILGDAQKISSFIASGKGTVGKLLYDEGMYSDVRTTVAHLDSIVQELQAGQGTAGKFLKDPKLYDDAIKTIGDLRTLLAGISAGEGTAGKLLKSDELHNQILGTLKKVDTTISVLNSGQGTLGQLLVNPAMYDSLNGTAQEMHGLMKDFRSNPKKFLRIKLSLF